jgi:hypothetical protein
MIAELRECLGREVRRIWIEFAKSQPNPKPSHLVPWDDLSEPQKEVDRQIGERLYALGLDLVEPTRICPACGAIMDENPSPYSDDDDSMECPKCGHVETR